MDIISMYNSFHGLNYNELKKLLSKVASQQPQNLADLLINTHYNNFVNKYASFKDDQQPIDRTISNGKSFGKRIPYIGWYWRNIDFANKNIPIGDCNDFIGMMANNKWDYPQRYLNDDECDQVIAIIDQAMTISQNGGILVDIYENTIQTLEKLWPLFQTFKIDVNK